MDNLTKIKELLEQSQLRQGQELVDAQADLSDAGQQQQTAGLKDAGAKLLAALIKRGQDPILYNRMQDLGQPHKTVSVGEGVSVNGNPFSEAAAGGVRSAQQRLEEIKAKMADNVRQRMGLAGQLDNQAFQRAEAQRQQGNFDKSFGLQQNQFGFSKQRQQADEAAAQAKAQEERRADQEKRAWDMKGRYEGTQDVKDFRQVDSSFRTIQNLAKTPSPSNDIALVFNFMKMNDPGSTVREGEYATASNAGGVEESVRNMYNKMMDGLILQPEQRNNFVNTAGILYNTRVDGINKLNQEYQNFGSQNRYPTENILLQPQRYTSASNPNNPNPAANDQFDPFSLDAIDAELQRRQGR